MAFYNRDRSRDSKKRVNDSPPVAVNIRESILEMRRIYAEKSDKEFAAWYSKRCGIKASSILEFLERVANQ